MRMIQAMLGLLQTQTLVANTTYSQLYSTNFFLAPTSMFF